MALNLHPLLIFMLIVWAPFALLTSMGSRARGERFFRSVLYGLAFPATWAVWFVVDNHAAGRQAFQSRAGDNDDRGLVPR